MSDDVGSWMVGVITIVHDGEHLRITTTAHPHKGWMADFTDDVARFVMGELQAVSCVAVLGVGLVVAGETAKDGAP